MRTTDAVRARYSVRAFLDRPVEPALVTEILDVARRSPSGGNLQPWHVDVLTGTALADLKARVAATFAEHPRGEGTEFPVYPPDLIGSIYQLLGIDPHARLPDPQGREAYATPRPGDGVKMAGRLQEIM